MPAPETTTPPAAAEPAPSAAHIRHHGRIHHRWRRHHGRYYVRPLGPAYYPGLGEFYPPYPNPCHPSRFWSGFYAGYPTYSCGW